MMKKYKIMKSNKKSGFTLVELIVVMGVMAVLALIMVPNLTAYIQKANVSKIKANMKNTHTSAELTRQVENIDIDNPDSELAFANKVAEYNNVSDEEKSKYSYYSDYDTGRTVVAYDENGDGFVNYEFDGVNFTEFNGGPGGEGEGPGEDGEGPGFWEPDTATNALIKLIAKDTNGSVVFEFESYKPLGEEEWISYGGYGWFFQEGNVMPDDYDGLSDELKFTFTQVGQ